MGGSRKRPQRTIVCPCHDVTVEDVRRAWADGYRHPDTVKRATAAFMGPCQGKYCATAMRELIVELGGDQDAWPYRPAVRSPLYPVYMGELTDPDDSAAGS
jgi:bacterioferritin-associated ferredoxin